MTGCSLGYPKPRSQGQGPASAQEADSEGPCPTAAGGCKAWPRHMGSASQRGSADPDLLAAGTVEIRRAGKEGSPSAFCCRVLDTNLAQHKGPEQLALQQKLGPLIQSTDTRL